MKNRLKTTIINGTYRKNGTTARLVKSFEKGLGKKNDTKIIDLIDTRFNFCQGCGSCMMDTKSTPYASCKNKDGFDKILDDLLEADIVVFATPIYEFGVTAVMKKFFERCLVLVKGGGSGPRPRNQKQKGKLGVIILTSGAPWPINSLLGMTRYPNFITRLFAKACGCDKIKFIKAGGVQMKRFDRKYNDKVYSLAKKISCSKKA